MRKIVDGKNGAKRCRRGKKGAKKEWVIVAYCCRWRYLNY
ncbi:hypothetical protein ECWI1_2461 [Escherichia coli]|nr:hypothetical protein ECWI1_2461 [Escherichia coli]SMB29102.1 hypothetical protein ECWI2_2460 [Escherichia coli]